MVALLLLAGCAAPTSVAAPVAPVAPAPSGTVQVRPESLLKLPLGTVVDLDTATVTALSDAGTKTVAKEQMWAFRVRVCISPDYVQQEVSAKFKWYASDPTGEQIEAEDATTSDAYGGESVNPGDCAEGLVYFPATERPDRIWYMSTTGAVGWLTD